MWGASIRRGEQTLVGSRRKKIKYNTIGVDWGEVQIVAPEGSPPPLAGSHILPVLAIDEDPPPFMVGGNKNTSTANQELEPWDDPPKGGGHVGHVADEDDESIGDHPTPTLGRETTPWWKKGTKTKIIRTKLGSYLDCIDLIAIA